MGVYFSRCIVVVVVVDVQSISDKHAILTFTKCNKVKATAI